MSSWSSQTSILNEMEGQTGINTIEKIYMDRLFNYPSLVVTSWLLSNYRLFSIIL
jgi:hypothetical protein